MSKLAKEITTNKAIVTVAANKKDAQKALIQSMLDSNKLKTNHFS